MGKRTTKKAGVGSRFDDYLKDEGTFDATAIKRVLAWHTENAMKNRRLTSAAVSRRAHGR